jgi:hypothetical protein
MTLKFLQVRVRRARSDVGTPVYFRERAGFIAIAAVFALMGIWLLPAKNFGPVVALFALAAVFGALAIGPSTRR